MKKLFIILVILFITLSPTNIKAQTPLTALQGYSLSTSTVFLHRLSVLLDAEAMVVLRESNGTGNHLARVALAKNILYSVDSYTSTLARQLVFDTNLLTAGFTVDAEGNPVDSSATDSAIRSQIATNWNAWTGS